MLVTVRHGKTDYNEKRIFSGLGDEPRLTKDSLLKAYELGKELKALNIDMAFVSPLTRAQQTFEEINKSLNIPFNTEVGFIERNFKEYEKTLIDLIDPKDYWDMDNCKKYDIFKKKLDEKRLHVRNSFIEFALMKIKEKYHDKNVLIVAHSGICRAIKYIVEGKTNRRWYEYDMSNLKAYYYKNW